MGGSISAMWWVRLDGADAGLARLRIDHPSAVGRLTDLATWSGLSLSATAELVDDLARLGDLARRPDPSDGRAKLILLAERGWGAVRTGRRLIAEIETGWVDAVGAGR